MAYNAAVANRIAALLQGVKGITSKEMFGGVAYMHREHMFIGVNKDDLMVRVGPEAHDEFLKAAGAREMDFTGRPMRGYLFVDPKGYQTEAQLRSWIDASLEFVRTLPDKNAKPAKKKS